MRVGVIALSGLILLWAFVSSISLSAQTGSFAIPEVRTMAASYAIQSNTRRARTDLQGTWIGNAEQIHFDQDAMQINFDPSSPFQWAPVWILDISGKFYVLAVWDERYIVHLDGEILTLTRAGFSGTRQFRKAVLGRFP